jgi:laminin, alpha 1/2
VCKEGYTGRACDYCAIGYFGYPNCQKCNCDVRGSRVNESYDVIDCGEEGQCPCKELTTGLKCDECRQATFGLSQLNPSGCTRCFCFGRSQECSQNPLMWGQVRLMRPRNVSVNYVHDYHQQNMQIVLSHIRNNQVYREAGEMRLFNGLEIFPGYSGDIHIASQSVFSQPFYFQLPKEFLGDKTSSYGGFLNFSVIADGCTLSFRDQTFLRDFPLVQLHSHYHLTLDYFPTRAINISESSHAHEIVLHESFWRYHTNGYNITRAIMMTALQNIKHIFLRATTCPDFNEAV